MTSLLVPVGFLLMNIVILLIWWIVRRERQRISQIEEKVDTIGRIVMDMQQQQKRQFQQMGQFHGDHMMAEEVANSSLHKIPETMTEESEDGEDGEETEEELDNEVEEIEELEERRPRIEHIESVVPDMPDTDAMNHTDIPRQNMNDDAHNDAHNDEDSDYGSELDSLTDDENVQIHNQNDAHDKISVSDVESLAEHEEHEEHDEKETTSEVKTIRLHEVSQSTNEPTPFQGTFELGEQEQEKPQIEIQEHHELDEERYKQLSKLTVKELRKLATEKGIRHVEKLKKKTLVIQLSVISTTQEDTNENDNQDNQDNQETQQNEDEIDTLD